MRLDYALVVLALSGCGLVAAQNGSATPAPSVTFAPTPRECTQICPTPAPEYCAPPCEYNYRYNPGEINKKPERLVCLMCGKDLDKRFHIRTSISGSKDLDKRFD